MRSGSSPLARGLRIRVDGDHITRRIIPARAGFTGPVGAERGREADHPRSRGVYQCGGDVAVLRDGSSPLARGLLTGGLSEPVVPRIIPARAGFTYRGGPHTGAHRDHPRSRGVYLAHQEMEAMAEGSSPLARGLRDALREIAAERRIIPARAGFTHRGSPDRNRPRDHPRSRGVYAWMGSHWSTHRGSSPLARGLRRGQGDEFAHDGIIPARAGFTLPGVGG